MDANRARTSSSYIGELIGAAWSGAHVRSNRAVDAPRVHVATPALVGATLAAFGASFAKRRSKPGAVLGAAVFGSIAGLGAGAAWASRRNARAAFSGAVHEINTARDRHWLATHPIAYG